MAVDEAKREVYFTSSQESPLEDHLYKVSLDGGEPQRLTKEAGHALHQCERARLLLSGHLFERDQPAADDAP